VDEIENVMRESVVWLRRVVLVVLLVRSTDWSSPWDADAMP
jgi:hypothetical protein